MYSGFMSPHDKAISVRLESDLLNQLEENRERYGAPVTEQIRRAVVAWLKQGGVAGDARRATRATKKKASPFKGLKMKAAKDS